MGGQPGAGAKLSKAQQAYINQLKGVLRQLNDASRAPRGKPFLVVTTGLSGPTKGKLSPFLKTNAAGTQLRAIEEAEILETAKRLRGAFGLPEKLEGVEPK